MRGTVLIGVVGLCAVGCAGPDLPERKEMARGEVPSEALASPDRPEEPTAPADSVPGEVVEASGRDSDSGGGAPVPVVEPSFDPPERDYPWLKGVEPGEPLWKRFEPPVGFSRVETPKGSFSNWLRHLPLKPGKPPVLLHDGSLKGSQGVHEAVVDIDVGRRDLQQCVDACMRLRAEYLWSAGRADQVCFRSVGGLDLSWKKWRQGYRPKGRKWAKASSPVGGWGQFRSYLNKVFGTCNTRSQLGQMIPVADPAEMEIGHVFLNRPDPDYFGHAVMIVDMATNDSGRRAFLLVQSYMPAQEIHVLKNLESKDMSPWFTLQPEEPLVTPEWTFHSTDLVRYPESGCSE